MKSFKEAIKKVEFELPIFLILAVKLPFEQLKTYGFSFLILCLAVSVLIGQVIRRGEKGSKSIYIFIAAFLLSGDIMKSAFMPSVIFSYTAILKAGSFLCFLISIILVRKPVPILQKPFFQWFIPLLCIAGVLFGQSFVFFFLPIILILMAFEKYKANNSGFNLMFLATWLSSIIISVIYIAIGFAGEHKYIGIAPIDYAFKILAWGEILKAFAAVLPLVAIFAILWFNATRAASDKRFKHILTLCMLEPVFVLLMNIFFYYDASDGWKYYIFMAVFTQFCLLLYFLNSGEKVIVVSVEIIKDFLKKYLFILLAIMIYLIKFSDVVYGR